jgi:hypothetical protein
MAESNLNKPSGEPVVLNLSGVSIPKPTESDNRTNTSPTQWGSNNNYPFFLLGLYEKSPIHANIINQKSVHIWGDGLMKVSDKKPFILKPNTDDSFQLFVDKILKSYLIYNAFAIEVNFSVDGTVNSYVFVPFERIGLSPSKDKVWYYGEKDRKKITYVYDRYDPRRVYSDNKSKIYLYEGYIPSANQVYPTPDYIQLVKTLLTDIAITDFNYNQITNHFSPSTMINFFNGTDVDDDIKRQVLRDLNASYTGESGKKLLINFSNPDGKAAEVVNISSGDWADAYDTIKGSVETVIYEGSGITSPALFGNKTAGQLGSTQELENAYEIWNNSYLRVKRTELEITLSELFGVPVFFQNKPLFSSTLSDDLKKSIYTINELRAEQGKEPIVGGDRIIGDTSVIAAPASQFHSHDDKGRILQDEDYELIQHLGSIDEDFEIVEGDVFTAQLQFDDNSDIATFILDNDITGVSSAELRALILKELGIKITTGALKDLITSLSTTGVISAEVRDGKFIIKQAEPNKKQERIERTVQTMFKYTKREEMEGDDLIPNSRGFCIKLMKSGKLYSREDIQAMSAIFGYDIMKHCGGFYNDPDTGETLNHCRHYFKGLSVIKKGE